MRLLNAIRLFAILSVICFIISCVLLYFWTKDEAIGKLDKSVWKVTATPDAKKQNQGGSRLALLQDKLKRIKEEKLSESNVTAVDIWSKAAIGIYLWEHILEGSYMKKSSLYNYGELEDEGLLFRFHSGPGVTFESIRHSEAAFSNVLLVLNNFNSEKRLNAERWLNFTLSLSSVRSFGVVLLGNDSCDNTWIERYLASQQDDVSGRFRFMFVVYDSPSVDNRVIFQWPLGVSTYRNFPVTSNSAIDSSARTYQCNFVGTVYANSSRQTLADVLNKTSVRGACFVRMRNEWAASETDDSLGTYIEALKTSDLTLCPVGMNAECYRIYEAMSYGSVPVIEDISTNQRCASKPYQNASTIIREGTLKKSLISNDLSKHSGVLRLLKHNKAPVIYIKDWSKLPELLKHEKSLSVSQKVRRRTELLAWYKRFKRKMRDSLHNVVWQRMIMQ